MHSEPPQNPNIAGAEPGAAAPNPNLANQPKLRFNCDTAQPATSQPHQNARAPKSRQRHGRTLTTEEGIQTAPRPTGEPLGGSGGSSPRKSTASQWRGPLKRGRA